MKTPIFYLFPILLFIFSIVGCGNSSSNNDSTNKFLAYNYAEKYVKQNLKSPTTAKFPGLHEKNSHIKELGNNKYEINSWVDSQNSFGAMVRTKFSCVIKINGNTVSCESINLNE